MIDSMVTDKLALDPAIAALVRDKVRTGQLELVCAARIQRDEVARTPDSARRDALLAFLDECTTRVVTPVAVYGVSRWGEAKYSTPDNAATYAEAQGGNIKNSEDAVILVTAHDQGIPVVTDDRKLRAKCTRRGIPTVSSAEFIDTLRPT
jgi:hypothetical protein